jgi:hypothetical protein
MRTRAQIESDISWKHLRLRDSQEHAEIVRLEAEITELLEELATLEEFERVSK